MFSFGLPKIAAHADDRLAERTNLDPSVLDSLRKDLSAAAVPYGTHHVALEDGSYAVLKDISRNGKKRHVVATVLSPEMSPPGTDVTREFSSSGNGRIAYTSISKGPMTKEQRGGFLRTRPNEFSKRYGKDRRERLRNALKRTQEGGNYKVKRTPGGFSSSSSHYYSTVEKSAYWRHQ